MPDMNSGLLPMRSAGAECRRTAAHIAGVRANALPLRARECRSHSPGRSRRLHIIQAPEAPARRPAGTTARAAIHRASPAAEKIVSTIMPGNGGAPAKVVVANLADEQPGDRETCAGECREGDGGPQSFVVQFARCDQGHQRDQPNGIDRGKLHRQQDQPVRRKIEARRKASGRNSPKNFVRMQCNRRAAAARGRWLSPDRRRTVPPEWQQVPRRRPRAR